MIHTRAKWHVLVYVREGEGNVSSKKDMFSSVSEVEVLTG
jgi:hypothetical protein